MRAESDGIRFPVTMISIMCVRATNMSRDGAYR